jgi:tetratricopeptide (TPR) repeat protein
LKTIVLIVLFLASPCFACLWDYDTLAQESAGMPDIKAVIAGGFPRNPPLYYEMRLERVAKLLQENPDNLDAYDAAGVACDRLSRHDEAIEWMARKQAAMERIGYDAAAHEQPNHYYRYLANLGTFHAHRWFSKGANREDMADMERGRELIAQAIKENPDAHFGREKYQLMAMEWVIGLSPMNPTAAGSSGAFPNMLALDSSHTTQIRDDDSTLAELGMADAIDGLAGLIVMGNAWESVDAFYALALAIQTTGRSSLANLAFERCKELIRKNGESVVPDASQGDELVEAMTEQRHVFDALLSDKGRSVRAEYAELLQLAKEWHEQRLGYMSARLETGSHPDTDPNFWAEFPADPNRMEIPDREVRRFYDNLFGWMNPGIRPFGVAILLVFAVLLVWTAYKLTRVIRRKEPFGPERAK